MEPEWERLLKLMVLPKNGGVTINLQLRNFVARVVTRIERGPTDDENYPYNGTLYSAQVIALAVETWRELNPLEPLYVG